MARLHGVAPRQKFTTISNEGDLGSLDGTVVPIMARKSDGGVRFVGTGFSVSWIGIIASAKHVLGDFVEPQSGNKREDLFILGPCPGGNYVRGIRWIYPSPIADLALGLLEPLPDNVRGPVQLGAVPLATVVPTKGSRIFTYAYPDHTLMPEPESVVFYPGHYLGEMLDELPESYMGKASGRCFATSMTVHSGASGGPVFDSHGRVFALNTSAYNDETSIITPIAPLLDLPFQFPWYGPPHPYSGQRTLRDIAGLGAVLIDQFAPPAARLPGQAEPPSG